MSDPSRAPANPAPANPARANPAHVAIMRSQLGRARGLGAAKSGTGRWWAERLTSVSLVPLTLWFIFAVFQLEGTGRAAAAHWVANPVNSTVLVALVLVTFHHLQLGLTVVIEDYIPAERARLVWLVAMKAVVVLLGLAATISVLKLAFTG